MRYSSTSKTTSYLPEIGPITEVACQSKTIATRINLLFEQYLHVHWLELWLLRLISVPRSTDKRLVRLYGSTSSISRAFSTGAAAQCTGGDRGTACGSDRSNMSSTWDGTNGLGKSLKALDVILANKPAKAYATVKETVGTTGNSTSSNTSSLGDSSSSGNAINGIDVVKDINAGVDLSVPTLAMKSVCCSLQHSCFYSGKVRQVTI